MPLTQEVDQRNNGFSERHRDEFIRRAVTPEFAAKSGCTYFADNEIRNMGFSAGLPSDQQSNGLQGIAFKYSPFDPELTAIWRIKPDKAPMMPDGRPAKYLSRKGDPQRVFYPHTTLLEHQTDVKVNILITEGEFKALALAEKVCPIASRKTCVIGLNGVNGGWHRDKITKPNPDGTHTTVKEGAIHLADELEDWIWTKRVVYIVFDSDVGTKRHATEFKRAKTSGSIGAEYTLAKLLRSKGAEVRIVVIPHPLNSEKMGADDYIAKYGEHQMLQVIYRGWVTERNIEAILMKEAAGSITFETAEALIASNPQKPPFVLDGILPVGGTMILAGQAGIGKSGVALNIGHAVANGEDFLGCIKVMQGPVAYIQAEIPRAHMAERIKSMGTWPSNLYMLNMFKLQLNYWEQDGFNKRRETGNREAVSALALALKEIGPKLVIFDPLKNFHSLSVNDSEGMTHLFEIFHSMAIKLECGICIVHHNRKTARSNIKYEGQEDMLGSSALANEPDAILSMYALKRKDETFRYKLLFSKLRHDAPKKPLELLKWGKEDSFRWEAGEWKDETTEGDTPWKIIEAMQKIGSGQVKDIAHKACIPQSTLYPHLRKLVSEGKLKKKDNLYIFEFNSES